MTPRAAFSNRFSIAVPDITYPATRDSAAKSLTPASISGAIASLTPFGSSRANFATRSISPIVRSLYSSKCYTSRPNPSAAAPSFAIDFLNSEISAR